MNLADFDVVSQPSAAAAPRFNPADFDVVSSPKPPVDLNDFDVVSTPSTTGAFPGLSYSSPFQGTLSKEGESFVPELPSAKLREQFRYSMPVEGQQQQLERAGAELDAAPLPTQSTLGQAVTAIQQPPKSFSDLLQVGRDIQQNNADTTAAMRAVAKQHGINPDTVAQLPSKWEQFLSGAANSGIDLGLSFISPVGLSTGGFGALPKAVQKTASLGFAAQMLANSPDSARALLEEESKPEGQRDVGKMTQAYLGTLADLGFGAAAGLHGASRDLPPETTKPTSPTPEQAKAAISDKILAELQSTLRSNQAEALSKPGPEAIKTDEEANKTPPVVPQNESKPVELEAKPAVPPVLTPDGKVDVVRTAIEQMRAEGAMAPAQAAEAMPEPENPEWAKKFEQARSEIADRNTDLPEPLHPDDPRLDDLASAVATGNIHEFIEHATFGQLDPRFSQLSQPGVSSADFGEEIGHDQLADMRERANELRQLAGLRPIPKLTSETPTEAPPAKTPTEEPAEPIETPANPVSAPALPAASKRAGIIASTEKAFDRAQGANKAIVDHQPADPDSGTVESWSVYSAARGNDRSATVFKNEDGRHDVTDENGNTIGWAFDKLSLDDALSKAREHVESGESQEHYNAHRDARSELLNTLDLPSDFSIKDIQDTKWGSVYYLLQKEIGRDEDGEPEYENYKVSIRNHEPSPFREKEFGANDAWFEVPKDASLQDISDAVAKVERFAWRRTDSKANGPGEGAVAGIKTPSETPGSPVSAPATGDFDRYNELVSQIKAAPPEQRFDVAQRVQPEIEQIKNRNGGVVPKESAKEAGVETVKPENETKPPISETETPPKTSLAETLAQKLEALKTGIKPGGPQMHLFGVAADLWDRAIEVAQKAIRAGGSVADAIDAAVGHIRDNFKAKWDESAARDWLQKNLLTSGRPVESVKQDVASAKAELEAKTRAMTDPSAGTQSERKQAAALAGARYRELSDELATHPDHVAEQILAQHNAITEANQILKPMGKTVSPEDFPNPAEVAAKLGPDAARRIGELSDQVATSTSQLARTAKLAPKMVDRITNEMMRDGRLPKMQEIRPNAGRTLQAMTDALNKMDSDSPKASWADRFNVAKKAAERYTAGKDFVTRAWGNSVAASKALWSLVQNKSIHLSDDFKDVMKSWIGYDQRTSIENARYAKALVAKVPQKVRRQAMSVWLDAGGDESLLRFQRDSVPDKYKPIWDTALKLTPDEKKFAQQIQADFAHKLDDGQAAGIIGKGRADYGVPQRWKTAPQIEKDATGEEIKPGKPGNPYAKLDPRDPFFSFQRETPSYFDGIMAKGEPEDMDVAHLVSVYDEAFHKALSSRGAIKALSEATARDGQPVVKLSGKADIRTGDNGGVFVDSTSLPKDAVTADDRPYQSVDHWALRGWKFAAKDSAGRPVMVKGDMLVHPDYVDFLKNELNTPRWTTKDAKGIEKIGRAALQVSSFLKASKFIGPFHVVTEALHASFHGVAPTVHGFEIDLNDPKQALLSRNMMIDMGRAHEMYDDGIRQAGGGIWKHVPGLGDAIVRMNNFTFNEYIPRLKMKVGLAVLDRNMKRYAGKLSDDQIAEITGRQMDAAFGGQNWRLLGANKNALAITRLGIVAPDFLISRSKVIGQVFKPYNREQRYFLLAQAVGVYTLCRVLNLLFSDDHNPHFEGHNWDRVVIGKRAYGARFIVSDAGNLAADLLGFGHGGFEHGIPFISGRLGVLPRMTSDVLSGRDLGTGQNEQSLFHSDNPLLKAFSTVVKDTAEWMTPMGVDGFLPGAAARGQTGLGSAVVATVGVSSRKESPANDVWNMARQFNLNSKDPKVVNDQKRRDSVLGTPSDYRALNNLLDAGEMDKAKAEVQALQAQGKTMKQILTHYLRSVYFTGSGEREAAFRASLTPAQLKTYQAAKDEQKARAQALRDALAK